MHSATDCQLLYTPDSEELKFLPEGPYSLPDGRLSWVGIQHGGNSTTGSVNILDVASNTNQSYELPGRPGFAFPTDSPTVFICGVERTLGLFDVQSGSWTAIAEGVDDSVSNTIINDGVICGNNVIFGCKDLEFQTKKAGLYLWKGIDRELIQLRDDQICSNGKAVIENESGMWLIDIDSPSKTITRGRLDIDNGPLSEVQIVVDLTAENRFPDGMIVTPDGQSLIVAFYDPGDPPYGVARQYGLSSGAVEHEWRCANSPRVTCPQLFEYDGKVRLVLTTAVEHMESDQRERHAHAGCLFIGDTSFSSVGDQPTFPIS